MSKDGEEIEVKVGDDGRNVRIGRYVVLRQPIRIALTPNQSGNAMAHETGTIIDLVDDRLSVETRETIVGLRHERRADSFLTLADAEAHSQFLAPSSDKGKKDKKEKEGDE